MKGRSPSSSASEPENLLSRRFVNGHGTPLLHTRCFHHYALRRQPARGDHRRRRTIRQQTGAGVLPVEIRFKDGRPQRVTMTQKEAVFRPAKISKKKLASALGISAKDFDPELEPEFVSTGIFNMMVPLRNRAALGKIAMNMIELGRLQGKNATMAYCFALGGNGKAFSRGMLPWELYEDAATGSAAGSLGAYLVKHERLAPAHTLSILQGAEMGRPSHIEVEVSQTGKKLVPRVSGAAVKVFEGTIRV